MRRKKTLIVNNNNLKYLEKFGLTVIVLDDDAMDKTYNDVKTLIDSGQINYIYKFKDDKKIVLELKGSYNRIS